MKRMRWMLYALVVASTSLMACIEVPEPPPPCQADAVWALNLDSGSCAWVSPCDGDWTPCPVGECSSLSADQCELNPACELVVAPCLCIGDSGGEFCDCTNAVVCQEKPLTVCEGLDEASCMRTPGCEPEYGWSDGLREDFDAGAPCMAEDCMPPSSWTYLGCFEHGPTNCYDHADPYACSIDPACQWVETMGPEPCWCDGFDCRCMEPEPMGGYCEPIIQSCYDLYDAGSCWSTPGCEWVGEMAPMPTPMPDPFCECEGDVCNCIAPVPYDPGYCQPQQPRSCYDLYDEGSCWTMPGCEWIGEGGAMPEPNCDCDDSGDCICWDEVMPYPAGYCQPVQERSCYDAYYPESCWSIPGCEWTEEISEPICECEPGGECYCADEIRWGWCQPVQTLRCEDLYDPYSCSSSPECEWVEFWGEPYPCDCDPSMPDCGCAGLMPPTEGYCQTIAIKGCESLYEEGQCASTPGCAWAYVEEVPPECWCDPNGMCFCDEPVPAPYGYCYTVQAPSCWDQYDEYSCMSDPACVWINDGLGMPCECPEGQPCECDWIGGYCMPAEQRGCYDFFDLEGCLSQGCEWSVEGFCQYPGDGCFDFADAQSCTQNPGCGWFEAEELPCMCDDDGACDCPAPSECWGAWRDESGQCRAPNDGLYPDYCCELELGYCGPLG